MKTTKADIVKLCRELRKNPTEAESILWQEIRKRKLAGKKFLRQHPVVYGEDAIKGLLFVVPDFYCAEERLVIELDGGIHGQQKEYDHHRDKTLKGMGYRILRFNNRELDDMDSVKQRILGELGDNPPLSPTFSEKEEKNRDIVT